MAVKKRVLSVIILSWNTKDLLRNCLHSLYKSLKAGRRSPAIEVIVVDNGSTDGSVEEIKSHLSAKSSNLKFKAIFNKKNLGFAKGNNQAIKKARGEFVLLLNSDTIVHSGAFSKMIRFLKKNPQAGAVGCKLLNEDGTNQLSAGSFPTLSVCATMLFKEHFQPSPRVRWSFDKTREVDWVMGAAIMIRRKILEEVGLLDENIFMYMEEVELCYRIKKAGFKVFFYPRARITHLGRGSSKSGKRMPILNIYKGLLYFYKKHRRPWELMSLRIMLKFKALLAFLLGFFKRDDYLKETYGEAFFLS